MPFYNVTDGIFADAEIASNPSVCALRFPGRPLAPGEVIPQELSRFLAAQLGLKGNDLIKYAIREETRHEHMSTFRSIYGYRAFSGRAASSIKAWLFEQAENARSNEDLARRFVEECRRTLTILPAISTIERLCADALVAAERRIEARIAERLDVGVRQKLDVLLVEMVDGKNAVRCPGAFAVPVNIQRRGRHMYLLRKPMNDFRRDLIAIAPTLTRMAQ